jgi:inorganic triphosphatase YgiF
MVMLAQKELEIKLEGAPSALRRLNGIPLIKALNKPPKRATEVSVYFDTDRHKLRKNGLMLRVRRIGKRYVQTIKAAGNSAPIERNEWETQITGTRPDLSKIGGTPLEPLMSNKVRRQLKPMFATRVHRTIYPLADDTRAIELTIDRGKIDTGDGSMPLCELELELKRGNNEQLFEIARAITHALPVRLALKSKSERGYQLIRGQQDAPVKTGPVDLPADSNSRDGFKVICFACLKQVVDNVAALVKEDPEGVHQMRVGLRRLRAAMSLFSDFLGDDQTAAIETELTWLAGELAPAREFEVLMERVIAPIKKQHGRLPSGVRLLSQELVEKRKAALTTAMNAVASARFRVLILEVAAWLELGHWIKPQDDLVRSRGDMPIEIFATEQLRRRWRKVRKTGKELAQLDAKKRHKLRIQVKKLRYTAEFFGELFQGKKAIRRQRKFTTALEQLQDGLGDLNDITVDEHLIAAAETGRRRSSPNSAFAAGLLTGREDARTDAAMLAAMQGYAKLVKVKPFWQ